MGHHEPGDTASGQARSGTAQPLHTGHGPRPPFPSRAITRLKTGDHTAPITARRSDIDINGHVNNVCYTKFCLESVPQEWEDTHRCMGLDIQFRSESFAGDAYSSFCVESEESEIHKTLLHGLTRSEDNKEIVRMRTWWKEKTSDDSKA